MIEDIQNRITGAVTRGVNLGFDLCDIDFSEDSTISQDLNHKKNEFGDIATHIKKDIFKYVDLYIKNYKEIMDYATRSGSLGFYYFDEKNKEFKDANPKLYEEVCFAKQMILTLCNEYNDDFYGIWFPRSNEELLFFIHILCKNLEYEKNLEGENNKDLEINLNLNWIDTSEITSFQQFFYDTLFNGDISQWNTSHVITMDRMFQKSKFNGDISQWDVSQCESMPAMFLDSEFNGDISRWDVSNVTNMCYMFYRSKFNGDLSHWNVKNVIDMRHMFQDSAFNQPIGLWTVNNCQSMTQMFYNTRFNRDLSRWDISEYCETTNMFAVCPIRRTFLPKKMQLKTKLKKPFGMFIR